MDRKDFQEISRIRLNEAKALLNQGLFDGAYYLAGYSVECALKACIAKATQKGEFPDRKRVEASHTHNLRELLRVADLSDARRERATMDKEFDQNWETVYSWSEVSRYRKHTPESARGLVEAISERRHGVITWIRRQW